MRKTVSLFKRDYTGNRLVIDEIVAGAEWVVAGEGIATRKYDGQCCMLRGGQLYRRYEATKEVIKAGTLPANWEACAEADHITQKQMGWIPVSDCPSDKYFLEATRAALSGDGTYELLGPKVQGNPENIPTHVLYSHEFAEQYTDCPRTFNEIRTWLEGKDIEGIVWHHPDGRMVKIKKIDFGMRRK